jgi:L-rhamnonate dehydratase
MKITEVRTRVVEWEGKTVPLPAHFCTNPMDLVTFGDASMGNFAFHGWVLVEIFTDTGLVGLGNAALSPRVTKELIDTYLKPLLIGADPWDTEFLWQQMYRRTMAFGRKGVAMVAISAVDIALWDLLGKDAKQPVYRLLGGRTKERIPVYASRLYAMLIPELRVEAQKYKDEGYRMMKVRFGWGPMDGAAGMQKNIELIRNVREVVGDGVDLMADAYMGWTLDYAKRMLPLLEPFHLRWLEEPVIPDDTRGYKELKSYGRVPIAGGEHEFTIFGFRELLEANALDYIQFDTNRVGGISQARKISALAESFQVPVVPHAGQMHNYHVVMANLNSPIAEFFPMVDVEVGNELFWYIFDGEPVPVDGYIDLDDNTPGLGLTVNEESLKRFKVVG